MSTYFPHIFLVRLNSIQQQGTSLFDTACYACSTVEDQIPDGVQIARNDTFGTPSCIELPAGTIGLSSGTTVASLTLEAGYYRTSNESTVILECYRHEACIGGNKHGDYCAAGYGGPCEFKVPCTDASSYAIWVTVVD